MLLFFFDRQHLSLVLTLILAGLDYATVSVDAVSTPALPAALSAVLAYCKTPERSRGSEKTLTDVTTAAVPP